LLSTYAARLSVPHAALSIHNGHLGSESGVMEIASWKINALNIRPWDLKVGPWNSRVAREIIGHWEMTVGLHIYICIYIYIYTHIYINQCHSRISTCNVSVEFTSIKLQSESEASDFHLKGKPRELKVKRMMQRGICIKYSTI
jgi:hypothetical protein